MKLVIFAPIYFLFAAFPANAASEIGSGGGFFPLAVGNSWKFCGIPSKKGRVRCEVWSISDRLKDGYILQVNPSEDDISILADQNGDIVDLDTGHHIFKYRGEVGSSWDYIEYNQKKKVNQIIRFKIISREGCYFGDKFIDECVSISRSDPVINIFEIVNYAKSIGPVSIKTYSLSRKNLFADMRLRKFTASHQ